MQPQKTSPIAILATVGVLVVTGTLIARGHRQPDEGAVPPDPSPLVVEPPTCAHRRAPLQRARELTTVAAAHLDRSAIVLGSGPAGLTNLVEAEHCARDAGDEALRQEIADRLHIERAPLETDYRARQLRLRRGLERNDEAEIRRESRQLLDLLGPRNDAYHHWLTRIARAEAP